MTQEEELMEACEKGDKDTVIRLLDADVSIHTAGNLGSLLHYAVLGWQIEIIQILCSRGANPNAKDSLSETPLHLAVGQVGYSEVDEIDPKIETIKVLLEKGADPNVQNDRGCTPVHHAAGLELGFSFIQVLLDGRTYFHAKHARGAMPLGGNYSSISNKNGETPRERLIDTRRKLGVEEGQINWMDSFAKELEECVEKRVIFWDSWNRYEGNHYSLTRNQVVDTISYFEP